MTEHENVVPIKFIPKNESARIPNHLRYHVSKRNKAFHSKEETRKVDLTAFHTCEKGW